MTISNRDSAHGEAGPSNNSNRPEHSESAPNLQQALDFVGHGALSSDQNYANISLTDAAQVMQRNLVGVAPPAFTKPYGGLTAGQVPSDMTANLKGGGEALAAERSGEVSTLPLMTVPANRPPLGRKEVPAGPSSSLNMMNLAATTTVTTPGGTSSGVGGGDDENEDSDYDDAPRGEKRHGRRKIRIEYIEDKSRRHITFSKRKAGIMKKAYELSTLTGTQVLLLVASETGHVYTFATPKLQPLITKPEGKNLIQACLNAPDANSADYANPSGNYDSTTEDHGKEPMYEDRPAQNVAGHAAVPNVPVSYAAAMAGLAGFQYPTSASGANPAAAPYLNSTHYPAYAAAQYKAALAAGYWNPAGGQATTSGSQLGGANQSQQQP